MIKKLFALIIMAAVFSGAAFAGTLINGAGATFPFPIYSKWFHEYNKINPSIMINYQSIGSGGGVKQITAKTVDFGASDAPMTDSEITAADGTILHIPTVIGAVAVIYNVPNVELKLTQDVLAGIFLGEIKKWDDPMIAAINPGANLPNANITVVHRSDGSGTTNIFTDYLAKISAKWATKVGMGKSVSWPIGLGAKGNEGVSGVVKQSRYTIGYAELSYAEINHIQTAALKNKAGKFVLPSNSSATAAALGAINKIPSDYRVSITNAGGAGSYPITGLTWILVYAKQDNQEKGKVLVDFLKWALTSGQSYAGDLYYSPLPNQLAEKVLKTIDSIQ
jgi:phosphate transport system substrate-binding protein